MPQIRIQSSGATFQAEANETILDAALRCHHTIPYGCRNGACGSCMGNLLSGKIRYEDRGSLKALKKIDEDAGEVLLCQAIADTDVEIAVHEVEQVSEIEVKKLPSRVVKLEKLCHDVMLVGLKIPEKDRLQFLAGQYLDVILRDGRRRSFSMANAPHDDTMLQLHIRYVGGGHFTEHVFKKMKEKDLLRIEAPLGTFFLHEDSNAPMLMVAGGTGFAPIKAIIEHSLHVGLTRPIHLFWGVRAKQDLYLHELAQGWAETYEHISYTPVLSEPGPDDAWQGRTGFVHEVVLADYADLSDYEVYSCGPPIMINSARDSFVQQRQLNAEHFYADSFEFASPPPSAEVVMP